ncbi:MAG: DUF433 domain-containing protein [Anaerolineae bacterium]|nr:DUF433 domain-containing protein [Anaerolineae bacterium]
MTTSPNGASTIVRTERGLTIAGTRITLYSILDYLHADWPPKLIQDWLDLTEEQLSGVLSYIDAHRDEVEREYATVLAQAEERRHYWEEKARQRRGKRKTRPLTPEEAELRAKFEAWKAKLHSV